MQKQLFSLLMTFGLLFSLSLMTSSCKKVLVLKETDFTSDISDYIKNGDTSNTSGSIKIPDTVKAATVSIIPKPTSLEILTGQFTITKNTSIILSNSDLIKSANYLNDYINKYYGFTLKIKAGTRLNDTTSNAVFLGLKRMSPSVMGGYTFNSTNKRIVIYGNDPSGTFYAVQTLIQLLPTFRTEFPTIAAASVSDYPRFSYRGMMLDCSRHFFPAAFVKKFIDYLALHKLNKFHWHLTDDQGWRIEIKKYPKLTEIGSTRSSNNPDFPDGKDYNYSGFYTQAEIRDIVKYAEERYVTIIPEIEIPGHSVAAIAAYPELTCGPGNYVVRNHGGISNTVLCPTPYTMNFYKDVLDEVMGLFPGKLIHLGGDEAPTNTWDNSAFCKQLMLDNGMTNTREIQGYFSKTFGDYLKSKGRTMIGWDEILDAEIPSDAMVMSWRGTSGGIAAARMNHKVVMSPNQFCYFDMAQTANPDSLSASWAGIVSLQKVYSYNPTVGIGAAQSKYIQGVQANLWTEVIPWTSKVEYKIFPRMEALAEIAWTSDDKKNYQDFEGRMTKAYQRYNLWGVSYFKAR